MEEDIDPAYLRQLETAFRSIKPSTSA